MGFRRITIYLFMMIAAAGGCYATSDTARLHIQQAGSWSQTLTSETDWSLALSLGYSDNNLLVLGGVRQQAPSTDITVMTRFGLGHKAWEPSLYIDNYTGIPHEGLKDRKVFYPAILTIQTHFNQQQDAGSSLDLTVSAGQDLRTKSPRNWWGFSYSLGVHMDLGFSPYIDKVLVNFNPTVLLSATKAFGGRVFLQAYCNTNTTFWFTSQLTFMMGGSLSVRLTDGMLVGVSGKVRFADLPAETGFITMAEATLFLNWQEALP